MRYLKLITLILLSIICTNTHTQVTKNNSESLKKYSYVLLLKRINSPEIYNGTCFFYKKNDKIFIISNYHAFTGVNPWTGKKIYYFDSIFIKYSKKNSTDSGTISMPWGQQLIGEVENIYFINKVDLYGVELKSKDKSGIYNCINELIDSSYFNKTPIRYLSYGYPSKIQNPNDGIIKNVPYFGMRADSFESARQNLTKNNPSKSYEQIESTLQKIIDKYYMTYPVMEEGRSGSPIFGEFEVNEKGQRNTIFIFMGVNWGMDDKIQRSWIIKPEKVIQYLEDELF